MPENLQRGVAVVQRQGHSTLRRAPRSDNWRPSYRFRALKVSLGAPRNEPGTAAQRRRHIEIKIN